MSMRRRMAISGFGLALSVVLGIGASPTVAQAQERGQVRVGHNRAWANPALILGITEGYFEKAGAKISEKTFNNPADIVQAIATGDLDAGVSTSGVLFTAIQKNVPVKGVALTQGGQVPPVTFMVRVDSGINSIKDMKGKSAVIGGFGGTTDLMLRYWLTKAGIDPKTDVNIRFVPFQLTLPTLVNKQVDTAPIDAMLAVKAQVEYPGQLKKLFSYVDVSREVLGNEHVNGLLLVFGTEFVKRDHETAVRFLEGYLRSIHDIQADPKSALSKWAVASKDEMIRKLEVPVVLPSDGKIYTDALQFDADMALKFGYVKEPVNIQAAIDNSLLDEAAKRLN